SEDPADDVGGPKKKPAGGPKFKDPKAAEPKEPAKKKPLKPKIDDDESEPEADATIPLPKKKPKDSEDPADDVGGSKKKPVGGPKFKEPVPDGDEDDEDEEEPEDEEMDDEEPEDEDEEEPEEEDEEEEPEDEDEEEPEDEDEEEPVKPKKKRKMPIGGVGDVEPDVDATIPLKKKKPKKKKPKEEPKKEEPMVPVKLRWIPPPMPPEEPIPMPPKEKTLCEQLKEERIPPTKRYARKPEHIDVYIPFEIPWEQSAALITQEGMGAFGARKDVNTIVNQGLKPLVQGAVHSECVNPLWCDTSKCSNRSGETAYGSRRSNVIEMVDNHEYKSSDKVKLGETVIPMIHRGAQMHPQDQVGCLRSQITPIVYTKDMEKGCAKESSGFISRQFASNTNEKAGSHIMDRRRNIVSIDNMPHKDSESLLPLLFDIVGVEQRSGAAFGAFRPLVAESEGGYGMSYEEELMCKMIVPFQTAPSLR
ncbi:hypothetical protein PFISCL1PPCAC_24422, partial [Pristionchus fissidentatus]